MPPTRSQHKPTVHADSTNIDQLLPDRITPLFGTLGYPIIHAGAQRQPSIWFYSTRLPSMFGPVDKGWQDGARPRYITAIARWKSSPLGDLSALGLIDGVRAVIQAIVEYDEAIQSGILSASYLSEALFTNFYDHFIHDFREHDTLAFLRGFESFPIRAEKSLYHLAEVCKENTALVEYLLRTPARHVAAGLWSETPPGGIDEAAWSGFAVLFTAHLEHYGHSYFDFDFSNPVLSEYPMPLIEMLRFLLEGAGSDPFDRQHLSAAQRESATQRLASHLRGVKKKLFRDLVDLAQKYAPLREECLADLGLSWPVIRSMLLELGRRFVLAGQIASEEDVFWLTEDEVVQSAASLDSGVQRLPEKDSVIDQRKQRRKLEKEYAQPSIPARMNPLRQTSLEELAGKPERCLIKGVAVSPGKVTAPACLIRDAEEIPLFRPGCVIVTQTLTSAWSPLFALASAVVADAGGLIGHSSIVVREYGIPAVLGTGTATEMIQDGQRITVDGSIGIVTL